MQTITKSGLAFIALYLLVLIGSLLFSKGFLTVRPVSTIKSDVKKRPADLLFRSEFKDESSWLKPTDKKRKLVIIVIDALRIDFVLPSKQKCNLEYCDKLSVLSELTKSESSNSLLFKFIADPPTATTQRLSGIAGGTLPAFIEAADNFAGQMSFADNIIYQLLNHDSFQKFHLMGDDTWIHLFPYILDKTKGKVRGYHSFDLFDLHTVDDGIKEQLYPTLESNQHDVIIAHFLGLDHCGHKFGPLHPECGKKLQEMDRVIRDIIKFIDDDTLLVVMGDHGMTDEGDHGGNSPKEVSSAIFFYSKNFGEIQPISEETNTKKIWHEFYQSVKSIRGDEKLAHDFYSNEFDDSVLSGTISQIDFPATISLFFGLPIPFGNIGSIIPEVFKLASTENACQSRWLLEAVRLNAHQMIHYFDSLIDDENFSSEKLEFLRQNLMKLDVQSAKLSLLDQDMEKTFECFLGYYKLLNHGMSYCRSVWACFNHKYIIGGIVVSVIGLFLLLTSLFSYQSFCENFNKKNLIWYILLFVQIIGKATNSFIIHEDYVCYFMFISCAFISFFLSYESTFSIVYMFTFRLFMITQSCREEQGNSCFSAHHRSIKILSATGLLGLLVWCVALYVISVKSLRNSRTDKFQGIITSFFYILTSCYHLVRWIHETFSTNDWWLQIALPRIIFFFTFFGIVQSYFKRNGSIFIAAISTFISSLLRPFGGFILLSVVLTMIIRRPLLPKSKFPKSLAYYLLGLLLFFMSGHQATLTSIQWEAAYYGFKELNQIRAFVFLVFNTFCGPILAFLLLIVNDIECAPYFLLISALELVSQTIFISLFLRHLMLWKVFTPRFILQMASVSIYFILYVLAKCLKA